MRVVALQTYFQVREIWDYGFSFLRRRNFFLFSFFFLLRQIRQGASPNRDCITVSTVSVYNTITSQMKKSQTNVNKAVKQ